MANVTKIFELFNGTRKMAAAMGLPPSTVQRWKNSGVIPARRQADVLAAAKKLNLSITMADVFGGDQSEAA